MSFNEACSRVWVRIVRSFRHLPMPARRAMARCAAAVFWVAIPKRRHVTLTNLRLCFPELSESERVRIARSLYVRLARAAIDHGTLWTGSAEEIRSLVRFTGLEHLLDPANRPIIVVSPHFVGLDAAGIALNTYVRGVSLYQRQKNPVWDKALLEGRLRFSNPVLIAKSGDNDLRAVMKSMREGLPFYYLPDMDHGRRNSIFAPFFGVSAATIPMVSRLARVTRAKVIWCIATMTESGYSVELSAPFENFPTSDPEADTRRLNEELERYIRRHPDQYFWVHRRFKTRPEGEPSVY